RRRNPKSRDSTRNSICHPPRPNTRRPTDIESQRTFATIIGYPRSSPFDLGAYPSRT
ncbi:hypothetical protein MCOR11_011083, partial [Pyricularia oryzae]